MHPRLQSDGNTEAWLRRLRLTVFTWSVGQEQLEHISACRGERGGGRGAPAAAAPGPAGRSDSWRAHLPVLGSCHCRQHLQTATVNKSGRVEVSCGCRHHWGEQLVDVVAEYLQGAVAAVEKIAYEDSTSLLGALEPSLSVVSRQPNGTPATEKNTRHREHVTMNHQLPTQ